MFRYRRKYGSAYPTAEGIYFVGIFAALCSAALMRQINLMMLIAGLMLGPLVYSWFTCRLKKSWFQVQIRLPEIIHADSDFTISLDLTNVSRGTVFALIAREKITLLLPERKIERKRKNPLGTVSALLSGNTSGLGKSSEGNTEEENASIVNYGKYFFRRIKPKERQTESVQCRFSQPGEYKLHPVELICRFPLGLFECRIRLGRSITFWVYPALQESIPPELLEMTAQTWEGCNNRSVAFSRSTGDFHSVSEHRPGESTRFIHWRSSARRGELVVRRFQPPESAWLTILLDLYLSEQDQSDSTKTAQAIDKFKQSISTAATIIYQLCRQRSRGNFEEVHLVLGVSGVVRLVSTEESTESEQTIDSNDSTPDSRDGIGGNGVFSINGAFSGQSESGQISSELSPESAIISGLADAAFYHQAMRILACAQPTSQPQIDSLRKAAKDITPEKTKVVLL